MELKAVIFDLDGVIVDTAEHHFQAWKRLAEELGIPCPPERKDQVRGVSRRRSLAIVLTGNPHAAEEDLYGLYTDEEIEELMAKKDEYYRELIKKLRPQDVLPGVRQFLEDLRAHGVKTAVATVSRNCQDVLGKLNLLDAFDVLVDGHSPARSKPEPDLFLIAAEKLKVSPSQCLVVEDAPAGVEAAEAAGMWSLALGPKERFSEVRPSLILPSLANVTWNEILALLMAIKEDPWRVWESPRLTPQAWETNFTVGNGYFCTRGTYEEPHPQEIRATLVHGLYDAVPIFFEELVNCPDWTGLEIQVDGEPLLPGQGQILEHQRWLDLYDGSLHRWIRWQSPSGKRVFLHTVRFASMADPHLGFQLCTVSVEDTPCALGIRAFFPVAPENPGLPPFPHLGHTHWRVIKTFQEEGKVGLKLKSKGRGLELGATMALLPIGQGVPRFSSFACPETPGVFVDVTLRPWQTFGLVKFFALYTSQDTLDPLGESQAKIAEALRRGYFQLLREHRRAWQSLWENCDIEVEGDKETQRAIRFNLYHLLIAAPKREGVSIPAKGLTGFGYRGHVFWDTEIFVLPFLVHTVPEKARKCLSYRALTLPGARANARRRGWKGALFAWESGSSGEEITPRWIPAPDGSPIFIHTGERQHHIVADVAYAVWRYWQATGDEEFLKSQGAEIILSTAQFWAGRAEKEGETYVLRHVIGPDEYHEDVDNNAYTNWMARWNLLAGVELWTKLGKEVPALQAELREKLELEEHDIHRWSEIAKKLVFPYDQKSGLIEQFPGFFQLENIDLKTLEPRRQSLWDLLGREKVNRAQVLKQPDVLMIFHLFPEEFSLEILRKNWEYYEPRTDHAFGSSLGPAIHAALAARLGEVQKAYEFFRLAAFIDLDDLRGNTKDGIHLASAGGLWQALVFGFAGLRLTPGGPVAWPQLPPHWKRLRFSFLWRGQRFQFLLTPEQIGPVLPRFASDAERRNSSEA